MLLLLPLFLLSPLSISAGMDAQEKSYGSSIAAPVQELHQLIIGEVLTIFGKDHLLTNGHDHIGKNPQNRIPTKACWSVCLSTITAKYISRRSFLLKPLNKGMFPIVLQICCRCYLAVGRDTNKEDSWTIELASQGGLTMPRIYVKCTHKCYTNVLTNIDIFDIIIGYWSTSIVNGF